MNRTVLIADDHQWSEARFREWLNSRGYYTLHAHGSGEALALARRHRPALIVIDTDSPEFAGCDTARRMKEDAELSGIPVIAVTGMATQGGVDRMRQSGCDAYVTRPVSDDRFLGTVKRFLA